MSFYEYQCDDCNIAYETQTFAKIGQPLLDNRCPECGGDLIRMVSLFRTTPTPEPYFNPTVGQMVTSNKDFEEKLHIGSDQQSERLGMEHRYVPMYPSEAKAHFESSASNDGENGESVERYNSIYNKPSERRIIT